MSAAITDLSSVDKLPPPHSEDRMLTQTTPLRTGLRLQMYHIGGDLGHVGSDPTPRLPWTHSAPSTSPRRPVDSSAHLRGPQGLSTCQVSAHSPGKTLSATFTSDAPPEVAAFPPQPWAPESCCVHRPASPDARAPDSEPPSLPAPPLPSPQPP